MSKKDKKEETEQITFEHECSKCGYNNRTTYNWPIKVYKLHNYKFKVFCTECGMEYSYDHNKTIEKLTDEIIEEQDEAFKELAKESKKEE